MKNNKFVVTWIDGVGNPTKEYKSYKHIEEDLHLEYHNIRELHKLCENNIQRKFLHPNLKYLSTKIKIETIKHNIENPIINNPEN